MEVYCFLMTWSSFLSLDLMKSFCFDLRSFITDCLQDGPIGQWRRDSARQYIWFCGPYTFLPKLWYGLVHRWVHCDMLNLVCMFLYGAKGRYILIKNQRVDWKYWQKHAKNYFPKLKVFLYLITCADLVLLIHLMWVNPSTNFCHEAFLKNVKADGLLFLSKWLKKTISHVVSGFSINAFETMTALLGIFTGMCVLAGCDFLSSIPGIGIAKAYALVSKYRNLDRVSILYLYLPKKSHIIM